MTASEQFFIFLRAINTGGRRVTNEDLLAPFVASGFEAVAAYQAAGNITLRTATPDRLDHRTLDPQLAAAFGFDAPSFVRSFDELATIVGEQPFDDDALAATEGRVQVALLRDAPTDAVIQSVDDLVPADDRLVVRGSTLYWLPVTGVSGSTLPVARIEQLLGPMTIRTLGTLQRLLTKFTS